jgi:hypothetical protein
LYNHPNHSDTLKKFSSGGAVGRTRRHSERSEESGRAGQDDFLLRASVRCLCGIVANDPEEAVYVNRGSAVLEFPTAEQLDEKKP